MTQPTTDRVHDTDQAMAASGEGPLYCTVHPDRETSLRCNKCGRPMCIKCAVKTPVGYRCRECVRGQQDVYFTATAADYVIAGSVSVVISLMASLIAQALPVLFMILLAPVVGGMIPSVVLRLTGRRRGRQTGYVVVAGIFTGALPIVYPVVDLLFRGAPPGTVVLGLVWPVLFVAVMASVAFSWFRMGRVI